LGSKQEILIEKCRTERAELKKAIQLATKQKEQFSLERKMVHEKVRRLKIMQEKVEPELIVELEKLKCEEKELKIRLEFEDQKKSEILSKQRFLSQKFSSNLNSLQGIKKEKESHFKENERMREQLNFFYYQIAKTGNLFGDNERISELELEIDELQGKILDKSENEKNVEAILAGFKTDLAENSKEIASLESIWIDSNKITEDEQMILDSMKSQIAQLDDLVIINQKILKSSEALKEEAEFSSASMIDTQETEVEPIQEKVNHSKGAAKNLSNIKKNIRKNNQKENNEQKGCKCSLM